jgi:hypothetical protein
MLITRISPIDGLEYTREIPVTPGQIEAWRDGTLIQRAMPNISADDREFLMTGITPEQWENGFADEPFEFVDDADPGDMDGDMASGLASAGWGTDEDYGGPADDF